MNDPLVLIAALVIAPFFYRMWWKDYQAQLAGEELPNALPGATPVAPWVVIMAVVGALVILAVEVLGEYRLGVVEEQSEMALLFCAVSVLVAPLLEEMIFRGFLYYDKTKATLVASIIVISVLFAVGHGHIWEFDFEGWNIFAGTFKWTFTPKGIFSVSILFLNSLWFYAVRFLPVNPQRSLLPCVAAHMASNLGVVVMKAFQGKIVLAEG